MAAIGDDDVDLRLHALERKEFIHRERRSSVADETEYAFGHLLVRDVAYSELPRAARAAKHRAAAEWIESLGRSGDLAEMLAHHYQQAMEYAQAAGESSPSSRPGRGTRCGPRATARSPWAPCARPRSTTWAPRS